MQVTSPTDSARLDISIGDEDDVEVTAYVPYQKRGDPPIEELGADELESEDIPNEETVASDTQQPGDVEGSGPEEIISTETVPEVEETPGWLKILQPNRNKKNG